MTTPSAYRYDLRGPEGSADPFSVYRRIHAEAPVHWNESLGAWVLSRYDDVAAGLRDPRLSAMRIAPMLEQLPAALQPQIALITPIVSRWTVMMDGADHHRLRSATQTGFAPGVIGGMAQTIQSLVDRLLDDMLARRHVDFIADFAFPLPAMVIAELLGAPPDDYDRFKGWSRAIAAMFAARAFDEALVGGLATALTEVKAHIQATMERRRAAPTGDLISHLVSLQARGVPITDDELVAECILLLIAGHETTIDLLANGLLALLEHRNEREKLRAQPDLMPSAVEEILRYDAPVKWVGRVTSEAVEYNGVTIPAGVPVILLLGAANRDPARFPDPDRFDITRDQGRHLGFGFGAHLCEGAPLARLEATIALRTILARAPGLRLAVERSALEYRPAYMQHQLLALPIEVS